MSHGHSPGLVLIQSSGTSDLHKIAQKIPWAELEQWLSRSLVLPVRGEKFPFLLLLTKHYVGGGEYTVGGPVACAHKNPEAVEQIPSAEGDLPV